MKKVLTNGNTFYYMKCEHCGCEFLYQHEDIDSYQEVSCPECRYWCKADKKPYNNTNEQIKL